MEGVGRNQDLRPHVLDAGDRADHHPGRQPTKSSSTSLDQKVGYEIIKGAVKDFLYNRLQPWKESAAFF